MIPLSQVVQVNPRLPKGLDDSQEISFVPMASISEDGEITHQETRQFSEVKKGFTYFHRGDVLLAKITPCFENGKSAHADKLEHQIGFGSTEFHVLRTIPEKCDPRFLYHLVRSSRLLFLGKKSMKGAAGHKRVPADFIVNFEVPSWPLDDQKRIAHLLGKVEGLIARRKRHLQQLDDLLKSVFLEMFGDHTEMKQQQHFLLGDFIEFLTSGSRGWAKYYSDTGDIFLRINNVKDGRLKLDDVVYVNAPASAEANRTRVRSGDLLLSITADLGRTAVIPKGLDGSYINQHLALIRFKEEAGFNSIFLAWYFSLPYGNSFIQKKNREGVKAGLNFDDIRSFQVVKPSIALQNHFAAIVEKVESLKSRYQQSLTDLESLYGALSQKAFKGELDLSRVVLTTEDTESTEGLNRETREKREKRIGVSA